MPRTSAQQFNEHYNAYSAALIKYLMTNKESYLIADQDIANSIVSEVFLTLINQWRETGNPGTIFDGYNLAYFVTTCRNIALTRLHKVYRMPSDSLFTYSDDESDSTFLRTEVEEQYTLLYEDDYFDKEEKLTFIEHYIDALPEKKRSLVRGHFYEHKSYEELAILLGYKDSNVAKTTNHRIILDMKRCAQQRFAA